MERRLMEFFGAPEVRFGWVEWVVLGVTAGALATYVAPWVFGFALVMGVVR